MPYGTPSVRAIPGAVSSVLDFIFRAHDLQVANADIVPVCPYVAIPSGAADYGAQSSYTVEYLVWGNLYRIRQQGTVEVVRFKIGALTSLTAVYIKVWRVNAAGTYDLVGTSDNILSLCTANTLNTITLASPIVNVQEGDYYAIRIESGANVGNVLVKTTGATSAKSYYKTGAAPGASAYAWASQSNDNEVTVPIELQMQAPVMVAIGDSNIGGSGGCLDGSGGGHIPFTANGTSGTNLTGTIPYFVAKGIGGITFQNMGLSGDKTVDIATRFTADVVDKKPRMVLMDGGTNDLNNALTWDATRIAYWVTMLDACLSNNIYPVVMLVPPCTYMSDADHLDRAVWNAGLTDLVLSKGGLPVSVDEAVGTWRATGAAGNLDDHQADYMALEANKVHFNPTARAVLANTILQYLRAVMRARPSGATLDIGYGADSTILIRALNADANKPGIRYDPATNAWQYSNNGTVWTDIGSGAGGLLNKYDATTAPAVTDDSGDGYSVGSVWINITLDKAYIALDVTVGAAVWHQVDISGVLCNFGATAAPAVTDDSGDGYSEGSLWVNVTADTAYILLDATVGAAVWRRIDQTIASAAEITTGTDTAKLVTPDAFAGSNYGKRLPGIQVFDGATAVAAGDGKAYLRIPAELNGWNLVGVAMGIIVKSTSGLPTVQIARGRQANATSDFTYVDVLSTLLTIDANEYDSKDATAAAVIDAANDDLATGDVLRVDVDIAGTGTKGLNLNLIVQLP